MALRFLADHCVSNSTVQTLREANHEVLRLKDVLPVESSDTIVITKAQEIDAILLSLNGDFSHIINYPPKNYKGIVALQKMNTLEDKRAAKAMAGTLDHPLNDAKKAGAGHAQAIRDAEFQERLQKLPYEVVENQVKQ